MASTEPTAAPADGTVGTRHTADTDPTAAPVGWTGKMRYVAAAEPTEAPTGYLEVAGLEDVTFKELTERHAWLLNAIGAVRPDSDHPGIRAAALALVAVLTELHSRATRYAASRDHPYWCACGFSAIGLAAFEEHFDQHPPEGPDGHTHTEITEELFLSEHAIQTQPDARRIAASPTTLPE